MKKVCVLTGAGVSAESGIKTFRDADGLWEGHDVMEVASPQGWNANQELVLKFYNDRRRQLQEVKPNAGHHALVDLEKKFKTVIITQNVDDLHERAGSSNIIHLHGQLLKVRSIRNENDIYHWPGDLSKEDTCKNGYQLRPHIVWFGEAVPELENAIQEIIDADIIIIIGTSMQVYPAASLTAYAPSDAEIYYIDPKPHINYELSQLNDRLTIVQGTAAMKTQGVVDQLLSSE